jgi:hypothetical protein
MQDARCRVQDAGCRMQGAGLSSVVATLSAGREDQGSDDFVEELSAVCEHFGVEEATATLVPAT